MLKQPYFNLKKYIPKVTLQSAIYVQYQSSFNLVGSNVNFLNVLNQSIKCQKSFYLNVFVCSLYYANKNLRFYPHSFSNVISISFLIQVVSADHPTKSADKHYSSIA